MALYKMCSKDLLPQFARIVLWIAIAHLWVIITTLALIKLEGCDKDQVVDYVDIYLSETFKGEDLSKLQDRNSTEFSKFKEGYDKHLAEEVYWRMRKEFNEPSKVYLFVLSAFTTMGNYGIYPQTFGGRLLYVLALPIGLLFYAIMLHNMAIEVFEIYAYAAVSIFPKKFTMWTIDQRELYEKIKVTFLAFVTLLLIILILGVVAILNMESYLTGVYSTLNLVFTIEAPENLMIYEDWDGNVVALILTIIYLFSLLFIYMILYSVFILFRYNNLADVIRLFQKEYDHLSDAASMHEAYNTAEDNKNLYYYNAKESLKNYDIVNTSPQADLLTGRFSSPRAFNLPKDMQHTSEDSDANSLIVPKQRKMKKKKRNIAAKKLKLQRSLDNNDKEDLDTPDDTPIIEVTQASPIDNPNEIHYSSDASSKTSSSPEWDGFEDGKQYSQEK